MERSSPPGPVRVEELELMSGVGSDSSLEPVAGICMSERLNESMCVSLLRRVQAVKGIWWVWFRN